MCNSCNENTVIDMYEDNVEFYEAEDAIWTEIHGMMLMDSTIINKMSFFWGHV